MSDYILHDHEQEHDGIDRRGFLKCMAWAGTGVLWTVSGGVLTSKVLGAVAAEAGKDFSFVQISDSHIGFNKDANKDVIGTLQKAIAKINALPTPPDFILHTGDLSHLSEAEEFDALEQNLKSLKTGEFFYVPGEHDVISDNGALYRERFGKKSLGSGWYSFDKKGVHFIGLVNVVNIREGGLGILGPEQLDWLKKDLEPLSASTPIVVFAHIPLWAVYPQWGWGTDDAEQALGFLRRFGSVNITFHTAMSTAFPQPAPGTAPKAGPMVVPAERLSSVLGITDVNYVEGNHSLAVVDNTLG
jgi:3',5'-cyclic-AMP phosphodiesterase